MTAGSEPISVWGNTTPSFMSSSSSIVGSRRVVHPQHRSHYTRAGMTTARLGLLCLPRSVASAVADARIAEEVGFSMVGVADSQSVFREMYATMALCAQATRRVRIGPSVTNAITRHPAVAASGIATVDEIAPGRAFFGIGSGDSAILNLAERPATLADMPAYVEAARGLQTKGDAEGRRRTARLTCGPRPLPIYLSPERPPTRRLADHITPAVEARGASPIARLLEAGPGRRASVAERFPAVGPAAVCADKLRGVVEAGIDGVLVTGLVADGARLIGAVGERVLPRLPAEASGS